MALSVDRPQTKDNSPCGCGFRSRHSRNRIGLCIQPLMTRPRRIYALCCDNALSANIRTDQSSGGTHGSNCDPKSIAPNAHGED
jgi:hypothetical protein